MGVMIIWTAASLTRLIRYILAGVMAIAGGW
jgi:hypothetical protein